MAWDNLGGNSQRTSADPSGNITNLTQKWVRYGGSDSTNGWAGGAITDDDSIYYFYSSYYPNIGGTGDRFSLNKYDTNGNLIWSNKLLGYHSSLGTWPGIAKVIASGPTQIDAIIYHDYVFGSVNKYTGAVGPGWHGGDTYGNVVFNPSKTKMFGCRTYWNEGFVGWGWFKAFDLTVYPGPLHNEVLWTKNADTGLVVDSHNFVGTGGNVLYDNSRVFYCPRYEGINPNFHMGIYCWNEAGVEQWNVTSSPASRASAGNGMLYMMESPNWNVGGMSLVARSQTDGSVAWSTVITGLSSTGQPPVLVNNLVIMSSSTGVHARNAITGAVVWDTAILGLTFDDISQTKDYTVLAAAVTSNTLVVTSVSGVHILSLVDGSQLQLYVPPAVTAAGTGSYLASPAKPTNPIIVGNRVYITITYQTYSSYNPQALVCLENVLTPPPVDVTPPTAPGNPTFSSVTTSGMIVSWTGSTDAVGVTYYNLFYRQSGGTWTSITKNALSHTFTGLASGTTYEFYVNAVDNAGNVSTNSATISQATTAIVVDVTPPSTPGTPTFSNVTSSAITVSWTGSTDNIAVSYYRLYWRQAGGTYNSIDRTTLSHTFTGLTSGITYEFYVAAVDTSGNFSSDSATASQTTEAVIPDTTIPSTPGNPTFSGVTATGMIVSWTPSTDASGVSFYTLFWRQVGGTWASINKTTLSHTFTGLISSTAYEFYVNASDNVGNISANSGTTSQTTSPIALFTQISGVATVTTSTGLRTTHSLNWQSVVATMELQRRTGKTSYVTIYTGEPGYSYVQADLNTNYFYRILLNGTTPSNEIVLMSKRK